jgi:hypothetical protein
MAWRSAVAAVPVFLTAAVWVASATAATGPSFSAPVQPPVGEAPFRVVAADLDGDGRADLASADHGSSSASVLLGRGDGSFRRRLAYRTAARAADIASADVNADGRPDLVTASEGRRGEIAVLSPG